MEYALWHNHGVRAVQKTLQQLHREAKMDPDGTLRLDGNEALDGGGWVVRWWLSSRASPKDPLQGDVNLVGENLGNNTTT